MAPEFILWGSVTHSRGWGSIIRFIQDSKHNISLIRKLANWPFEPLQVIVSLRKLVWEMWRSIKISCKMKMNYVLSKSNFMELFLLKEKKKCGLLFPIYSFVQQQKIDFIWFKEQDCLLREVQKHYWKSIPQKEGPVTIEDTVKSFLYWRISTIVNWKMLSEWSYGKPS